MKADLEFSAKLIQRGFSAYCLGLAHLYKAYPKGSQHVLPHTRPAKWKPSKISQHPHIRALLSARHARTTFSRKESSFSTASVSKLLSMLQVLHFLIFWSCVVLFGWCDVPHIRQDGEAKAPGFVHVERGYKSQSKGNQTRSPD